MTTLIHFVFVLIIATIQLSAVASEFTGQYTENICQYGKDKPCSNASFTLIQKGSRICGDHSFGSPGEGRINEGFPGSVRGTVVGRTAILVVTSGRNGGIVLGKAVLVGPNLQWQTLEEISEGTPPGDTLILDKGILKRIGATVFPSELVYKCQHL
jgi:hypothetical protein